MSVPVPTPIFRFMHVDNLAVCLRRGALHAPNHTPNDGLSYRTIHNADIQQQRGITQIPCGSRGTVHDYVAFYFGPRSPMLLQLHTGRVAGYGGGQQPLIYLVSTVEAIVEAGARFVFSDGHGIAAFTQWFDDPGQLGRVDFGAVYARYWSDTVDDMDRQRRKQAEFLVYQCRGWGLMREVGVLNAGMKSTVEQLIADSGVTWSVPVNTHPEWYY